MMMPSIFGRTYLMMIGWISRLTDLTENSGKKESVIWKTCKEHDEDRYPGTR